MSTLIIKRRDGSDLPRGTRVAVVTNPNGFSTWDGIVSRSANVDLDPGVYDVVVHKSHKTATGKFVCFKEVTLVYHDITKEQVQKIESMEGSHIKAIMTPEGNRWKCTYAGCSVTGLTSPIAGKVHVLEEHYGEFPLGQPGVPEEAPKKEFISPPGPEVAEAQAVSEPEQTEEKHTPQRRKPYTQKGKLAKVRNTAEG